MLELFCDVNVVVPICVYLSWRCFWSKKKSKRSQNNHSNNERYDNSRVFFFFRAVPYECLFFSLKLI